MTEPSVPGRSIVTRRALLDLVRAAVVGSYGVVGLSDPQPVRRVLRRAGLRQRGIAIEVDSDTGALSVDVHLLVAHGLPIAEVARQVESALRHALRTAVRREPARVVIHVNGIRVPPAARAADGSSGRAGRGAAEHGTAAGGNGRGPRRSTHREGAPR